MLETIGSIVLKYWVEFILGLIVAGGGFLIKRYLRLEKEERQVRQKCKNSLANFPNKKKARLRNRVFCLVNRP